MLFYNNFLSDVIANYIAFKSGDNYDELMRSIFQDKVKIKYSISYEKHPTLIDKPHSTQASYSYQTQTPLVLFYSLLLAAF